MSMINMAKKVSEKVPEVWVAWEIFLICSAWAEEEAVSHPSPRKVNQYFTKSKPLSRIYILVKQQRLLLIEIEFVPNVMVLVESQVQLKLAVAAGVKV